MVTEEAEAEIKGECGVMGTGVNSREIIVDILKAVSAEEEYSHVLIRGVLEKYNYLDGKEKAFIKHVTEGCLERRIELDYIIDGFSKTPVKKMKPLIREILRMSVYQILYMSRVPDSAAINEAVKLAKKRGFTGLSGFVNGVLRKIASEGGSYPLPDKISNPTKYLSVKYSMPEWLVEKFTKEFGEDKTETILKGLLSIRPLTIRIQRTVSEEDKNSLISQMKDMGVEIKKHPYLGEAYCLENVEGVSNLPGFDEGLFAVQDISSMLAVLAAGIKQGDKILDVCAAPGGKTAYAAMLTGETGSVVAGDVSEYKTSMIEDNCERLKLDNVSVIIRDASERAEEHISRYDVVIADVPCLGLGVIGRKKEIKYRIKDTDIESITFLQKKIVEEAVKCVKPGGVMLYSTCSMTYEENEAMVKWMEDELAVAAGLSIKAESMKSTLPADFIQKLSDEDVEQMKTGRMQLLPGVHESDGFFFARMRVNNG